jgi:hypothetical protein
MRDGMRSEAGVYIRRLCEGGKEKRKIKRNEEILKTIGKELERVLVE